MSKRVLIVEDDALIGQEFHEAIAAAGYEVLGPARSMAAGLYLAQVKRPDLAIIDIGLAGTVNGIEGGRRLRVELGLPIVFVSGRGDAETRMRAAEIGPVAFLEKPCSSRMLIQAIDQAFGFLSASGHPAASENTGLKP
jgi:two-component system, response regulator PdtaR